jgi:hypothetical protein
VESHLYFFCSLFNDDILNSQLIGLKDWMILNIETVRMWQKCCQIESLVARFIQGTFTFTFSFLTMQLVIDDLCIQFPAQSVFTFYTQLHFVKLKVRHE